MQNMEVGSDSPKTSEACQVSKLESGGRNKKRGAGPGRPDPAGAGFGFGVEAL